MASGSIRFPPTGPGGVNVLAKVYFTPTGDSFDSRMQSRIPKATRSIASWQSSVPSDRDRSG